MKDPKASTKEKFQAGVNLIASLPAEGKGGGEKGGGAIVGTNHSAVLPTQDWINPDQVKHYEKALMSGEKVDPIRTYEVGGKTYIEDGHHRYVASQNTGISVPFINHNKSGPIGFPDWSQVTSQTPE